MKKRVGNLSHVESVSLLQLYLGEMYVFVGRGYFQVYSQQSWISEN